MDGKHILELWHGPTCAFKDMALQILPHLLTASLKKCGETKKVCILVATSGDTGKAALEGFADVEDTKILVFYPHNGVSDVQKLQMVTQRGENVSVAAVKGNFDDAQTGVKTLFGDTQLAQELSAKGWFLSSANSINWGRLLPQIVYYFSAYCDFLNSNGLKLGDEVDFAVPTGNFGDILAGCYAREMGLPVGRLICASNANNVLTDFLNTGVYDRRRDFVRTSSPSMDILVSSNLERLLYLAAEGDTEYVSACMEALARDGVYKVNEKVLRNIRRDFSAGCCDEAETEKTIGRVWEKYAYLCDPHTAVAFAVAEEYKRERQGDAPVVVLSTASPYKFPGAVLKAIGGDTKGDEFAQMETLSRITHTPIPQNLSGLRSRKVLHKDLIDKDELPNYILDYLKVRK